MSTPQRNGSIESASDVNGRKRVCKACDRCRMKKSKCDGSSPCSRCQADNTICVFGERKKSHDKKYPHGYTEMLEQQQAQLVACVREMYQLLQKGEKWPGNPLKMGHHGQPLTHDILERLNLLEVKSEGGNTHDGFEEDLCTLERRAVIAEVPMPKRSRRHGSVSSESDREHRSTPSDRSVRSRTFDYRKTITQILAPPTPPSANPLQQVEMNIPFKMETQSPLIAPDYIPNMYFDQLQMRTGSYSASYDQFGCIESGYQGNDLATNPIIGMPSWPEFPTVDFMDLIT